ncbi:hypothetical protein K440DRAFT_627429 [Wilcoxina mikolae CBS 423.85]|nr:hypothetical protein K440DRAFT_627429 [Wilcoxina mikolae CBS 423.85]
MAVCEDDLALILSFQMEELASATTTTTSTTADWDLAKSLLESDLQQQLQIWEDHVLAASMYRAAALDGELIEQEVSREIQVQADHALAEQIDQGREIIEDNPPGPPQKRQRTAARLDPAVEAIYNGYVSDITPVLWKDRGAGEGTSQDSEGLKKKNPRRIVDCDVCTEAKDDFEMVSLGCGHNFCLDCLRLNFTLAIDTQNLDILRCCQPIQVFYAADVLSEDELAEFHRLLARNHPGRKIQCSGGCGTILLPAWMQHDFGLCMTCNHQTCLICGKASHTGECPNDSDTQSLFDVAETEKWQRCFQCGTVVQLQTGCYHITCRCRGEFCYICGVKWKTCTCPTFEEQALIDGQPRAARSLFRRNPLNYTIQLDVLATEVRTRAQQHEREQRTQLQALQALRAERTEEREAARTEQKIREKEAQEKEAYLREQREVHRKKREKADREIRMRMIVAEKLIRCSEDVLSRSKGKQKASNENLDPIVDSIVAYTLAIESQPPKPPAPKKTPAYKKKKTPAPSRKKKDTPHGVLRLVGFLWGRYDEDCGGVKL